MLLFHRTGRHTQRLSDQGSFGIDGLPCGNVFAPPPLELRQMNITDLKWETDETLVVVVGDPIVNQDLYEWKGFRVLVRGARP